MKIKSLLIGSAMAAGLTSGAQAADAIVYADPEPMEYVRICDVYGAGFFYIPGTETCLRIGGYMRFQFNAGISDSAIAGFQSGYGTLARFAPNFDVRSSSDWGTIRGFAEVEFDYNTTAGAFNGTFLRHAFIDIGDRNFVRIGRNWSPYGIWAGPGGNINDGVYGRRTVNNIAYYFNSGQPSGIAGGGIAPGAGFSGFIALVDNERTVVTGGGVFGSNTWRTDVEAGVGFGWQGGFFRVAASYDSNAYDFVNDARVDVFSAKAGIQHAFGALTARAAVFYNGNTNVLVGAGSQNYGLGATGQFGSRWSILGGLDYAFSPAAKAVLTAQWFDDPHGAGFLDGGSARWTVAAGVDLTPATGLRIRPEVTYLNRRNGTSAWGGVIRLDRSF